jgi:hypothetical protein
MCPPRRESKPSVPGLGDARGLPSAVVLVQPRLCFADTADARRKPRPVLASESARRGGPRGQLRGINVTAARDAVNMLALGVGGPTRPLTDQSLAFALGETLG